VSGAAEGYPADRPTPAHSDQLDELREALGSIAEQLADLALAALHEAVEAGATSRPPLERQLTRARHAVERAAAILAGADEV
jgi:hypothetical protein